MTEYQKTIAVDFDGTLCDHEYPFIGAPKPGASEALQLFRSLGYWIIIWTCRTCSWNEDVFGGGNPKYRERVLEMKEWLEKNDMIYDEIDYGERGKPLADFYIDDKAIRFSDNWLQIMESIKNA